MQANHIIEAKIAERLQVYLGVAVRSIELDNSQSREDKSKVLSILHKNMTEWGR